ncbi:MAG: hypothetical protein IPM32_16715 [Ignavibacteriae bacterium]|nr:hypothetical protein [Ignavibacteriota bacterium]
MIISREEFIKVIAEKVISRLFEERKISHLKDSVNENLEFIFDKKLLTYSDVELTKIKGFTKIKVRPKTIITPLANDFLTLNGIKIIYSDNDESCSNLNKIENVQSNKIAVLTNLNEDAYKNKTKEILLKLGIESECFTPKSLNSLEFQNLLDDLVEKTENDFYKSTIIISNESFQLRKRLENLRNFKGQICWEIGNSKVCSVKSKYLFINSNLIGFKMLEQKIVSWLNLNSK